MVSAISKTTIKVRKDTVVVNHAAPGKHRSAAIAVSSGSGEVARESGLRASSAVMRRMPISTPHATWPFLRRSEFMVSAASKTRTKVRKGTVVVNHRPATLPHAVSKVFSPAGVSRRPDQAARICDSRVTAPLLTFNAGKKPALRPFFSKGPAELRVARHFTARNSTATEGRLFVQGPLNPLPDNAGIDQRSCPTLYRRFSRSRESYAVPTKPHESATAERPLPY